MMGFDASKLTDSELEKALALPEELAAPSPEQTTEADVTVHMFALLGTYVPQMIRGISYRIKRLGDDQLEVTMADGARFQINVNRVR